MSLTTAKKTTAASARQATRTATGFLLSTTKLSARWERNLRGQVGRKRAEAAGGRGGAPHELLCEEIFEVVSFLNFDGYAHAVDGALDQHALALVP